MDNENITFYTFLIVEILLVSSLLFFEVNFGNMFLRFLRIQDKIIALFRLSVFIYFIFFSSYHLFELQIRKMVLKGLWI